ncbi:MAG: DnaJ domain [Chloroflexota bacterium]|nr:DnaJ domain [Chloroflexota bacterium]
MNTIFGRLGRKPRLSLVERQKLLQAATRLHSEGVTETEIEAFLADHAGSPEDAVAICAEARTRFERDVASAVPLPPTVRLPINFYFALGVTPRASVDRIRAAYRRRAREVHPDKHRAEMNGDDWNRLMAVVSDAEQVLTDAAARRAYDVHWLNRSRRETAANATPKERRGDWATRYHWYLAEVAEIEDRLELALSDLHSAIDKGQPWAGPASQVGDLLEDYEARVLHIRTQTYAAPDTHQEIATRVRRELQRNDAVISDARRLLGELASGANPVVAMTSVTRVTVHLAAAGAAHRRFEIEELQEAIAA